MFWEQWSRVDAQQGELPLLSLRPALQPCSLHGWDFVPVVFSVGSWLGCWCSCRAPGPEPAPARWRGALRRAALHSLSRLPLFNQIIAEVNLLDSRSPLPPPSPPAHAWLPLPTEPGSILGTRACNSPFWREGQRAAASVCQDLPFPLSLFFFFFLLSLFYEFPVESQSP